MGPHTAAMAHTLQAKRMRRKDAKCVWGEADSPESVGHVQRIIEIAERRSSPTQWWRTHEPCQKPKGENCFITTESGESQRTGEKWEKVQLRRLLFCEHYGNLEQHEDEHATDKDRDPPYMWDLL
jgi:hypothetical protein